MNFGNLLYLASQFPPHISGIVLMLLITAASAIVMLSPNNGSNFRCWAIWLNYRKVVYICTGLLLLTLLQTVVLPYSLNSFTAFHIGLYLILYGARRKCASNFISLESIKIVTWLNSILLFTSVLLPIREINYIEVANEIRFASFYVEPSYAAFIYVLNLQQLWMRRFDNSISVLFLLNLACLLSTFSGSGYALLLLLFLAYLIRNLSLSILIKTFIVLVVCLVFLMTLGSELFDQAILNRLQGIFTGEIDNSVFLRFVAPWIFMDGMASKALHLLFGTGIGGIVEYISYYRAELDYLVIFTGEDASEINNGYVIIFALLGFPLATGVLFWILWRAWKSDSDFTNKLLFIAYPFFSGWIIHPLFFLLMALSLWGKNQNAHSRTPAERTHNV